VRATYINVKDMVRLAHMKEQNKQEGKRDKSLDKKRDRSHKQAKRPVTAKRRIIGQEMRQQTPQTNILTSLGPNLGSIQ